MQKNLLFLLFVTASLVRIAAQSQAFTWTVTGSATETWYTSETAFVQYNARTIDGQGAAVTAKVGLSGTASYGYSVSGVQGPDFNGDYWGIGEVSIEDTTSSNPVVILSRDSTNSSVGNGSFPVSTGHTYVLTAGTAEIQPGIAAASVSATVPDHITQVSNSAQRTATAGGTATVSEGQKTIIGSFAAMPQPQNGGSISGVTYTVNSNNPAVTVVFSDTETNSTTNGGAAIVATSALESQSITFPNLPAEILGAAPILMNATASSGLPVSYSSSNAEVATISGSGLTIVGVGSAVITAIQGGNATYSPAAAVSQTVTVNPPAQSAGSGSSGSISTGSTLTVVPFTQTAAAGSTVRLTASVATGVQWQFDGTDLPNATNSVLTISPIGSDQAGVYTAIATGSGGVTTSATATVNVTSDARLSNISSRALVGPNSLVVGFVIGDGTAPKQILVRGVGPELGAFGINDPLGNPTVTLFDSNMAAIASNSGWSSAISPGSSMLPVTVTPATAALFSEVFAFGLPADSADCAMLAAVPLGAYSAEVTGLGSSTGVAIAEIYDADQGVPSTHIVNLSTRALTGTGSDVLIAGFVVAGTNSETLLIRGVGPALAEYGVAVPLQHPQLMLFDHTATVIASNTGWSLGVVPGSSNVAAGPRSASANNMALVGAFALPSGSADCAMLVTLPPGSYSAEVAGLGNTTGIALVEVYEMR